MVKIFHVKISFLKLGKFKEKLGIYLQLVGLVPYRRII
jgi:hypothetical protein